MRVSAAERTMNYLMLALFALFALWPMVSIVATSLGPRIGEAPGLHLDNFVEAWSIGGFSTSLWHSVVVALIVVTVAATLSIAAGYAFGTMRFRGSGVLFYLCLLGLMIPAEAVVIPLFFDLRTLGLTDTFAAVALPQIAQSIAFGTFWMRAQFRAMPFSLVEAAALDGAGPVRTLTRILAPASMTGIATLLVLVFMWTWNEFLIALVMSPSRKITTAPLGLSNFQGQYTAENVLLAAGAIIVAAPVVAMFLFLQRYFIKGMLEGAAKE